MAHGLSKVFVFEKWITLAEINRTVALNMDPIGSMIMGKKISDVPILRMDHSRIRVLCIIVKFRLHKNIEIDIVQRRRLHRIEMFKLYNMVKSIDIHI